MKPLYTIGDKVEVLDDVEVISGNLEFIGILTAFLGFYKDRYEAWRIRPTEWTDGRNKKYNTLIRFLPRKAYKYFILCNIGAAL